MAREPSERSDVNAQVNQTAVSSAGRGRAEKSSPIALRSPDVEVSLHCDSHSARLDDGADVGTQQYGEATTLRASLDTLVRLIERVAPGMRGSVLLLDDDGVTLRHGAAPNLPDAYCRLIDGEKIGPIAGSCGTAAYRRERVIVREISSDPLWANYRLAAEPFGLAACWSTPIFDAERRVLGTFAMYYGEPREPTAVDIALTETATALAAEIITGERAVGALRARTDRAERLATALRESEARYHQMTDAVPDHVWTASPDGGLEYANHRMLDDLGCTLEQLIGEGWEAFIHPADLPRLLERWRQSVATGTPHQVETRFRCADGEYRCYIARGLPVRDAGGHVVRWFGTCTNIDDQRRVEAALRESEEQLRYSEGRLRAALEASSTSTFCWDMHTNGVECDEGLFHLFGVDPATAAGSFELFVSLIHPDDRDRVIAGALRCAAEGVDLDEEFRIVRQDGTVRWAVDKAKTVFDDDGKPRYLIGACVDVTERRLRDEQFRALAESIPQLAWMADATGARDWFNQRWYDYTGATPNEAVGWAWQQFHHPEHRERVLAGIRRAWAAGEPWEDTFPLRGRDGQYRWVLSRARPIRDADGNIGRWFGTSTDINELREAELARDRALADAKNERERLYDVFMQAPAAITVLEGPDHIFTVVNSLYSDLVGGRAIVGRSLRDAFPEIVGQGFLELLDGVYTSGEPYSARERVVSLDRDGDGVPEDFYVDFVYQPLKDVTGTTFGILVHALDVTTQVRARQEITAARAEAERANKAKSEFLAAMSHDLRTPLNAIGGYADLTAEGVYGPVTDAQRKALERIRRAGSHLLSLINDILGFAKIEAGRVELRISDVPVNEIVATAGAMIEVQASNKGISFAAQAGTENVRVRADRERMTQILTNLLTNAVKFTEAGSITLEWRADDRAVALDVRDTGRGIPPDKLASVFDPFVQAGKSAEERQQGVGLGLAISRELSRAMGGDLTVESVVGRGSTFTLRLPRAADVAPAISSP